MSKGVAIRNVSAILGALLAIYAAGYGPSWAMGLLKGGSTSRIHDTIYYPVARVVEYSPALRRPLFIYGLRWAKFLVKSGIVVQRRPQPDDIFFK